MSFSSSIASPSHPRWVDEMVDAYADWREACAFVQDAYDRWCGASAEDESLAFGAYGTALDNEERAALVYAGHVQRVRELTET